MLLKVKSLFDKETWTFTHIVFDPTSKDALVIDPVLNYNPAPSTYSHRSINEVLEFLKANQLKPHFSLDTHIHADHVSGSRELKKRIPGLKTAISENITVVQKTFGAIYNLKHIATDGSQFDHLLKDGVTLQAGTIQTKLIATPGHTPACVSILVEDMIFTGDVLFMPDYGTGRCDFPGGSAEDEYRSIHDCLYELPDSTRVFVGHDYMPNGRDLKCESTIGEERKSNIVLRASCSKEEFIKRRNELDQMKSPPRLLYPSVQINMNGGILPEQEDNGVRYLKIPFQKR